MKTKMITAAAILVGLASGAGAADLKAASGHTIQLGAVNGSAASAVVPERSMTSGSNARAMTWTLALVLRTRRSFAAASAPPPNTTTGLSFTFQKMGNASTTASTRQGLKVAFSREVGNRREKISKIMVLAGQCAIVFPAMGANGGYFMLDELDRRILAVIQEDASLPVEAIAAQVNSSKSPVWSRIRKLRERGVIDREVAILDPEKVDRNEVFFVTIKTSTHSKEWLERFAAAIREMGEVQEAHRLAGEIDYILKIRVRDTRAFDSFYKKLVAEVELFSVTSMLSMETLKETTFISLDD